MPRFINPVPDYSRGGKPLAGGKLFFFDIDTGEPKNTFADNAETEDLKNTHPVILDAEGRAPNIFFSGLATLILQDKDGVQVFQRNSIGEEDLLPAFSLYFNSSNYQLNSIVSTPDGRFFISLGANNKGNDPTTDDGTNWKEISFNDFYAKGFTYSKLSSAISQVDGLTYISVKDANKDNEPSIDTGVNWVLDNPTLGWVTGKTYFVGEESKSPIDFRAYKSQLLQAGNEPSVDNGTNWLPIDGVVTLPVNVLPADTSTGVLKTPFLTIDAYSVSGSDAEKEWVQYQLSSDSFASVLYDSGITADFDGHLVETALPDSTLISQRARSKGVRTNITEFSDVTTFTTSANLSESFAMVNSAGTGIARTVVTGVDLSTQSGTVWIKNRNNTGFIKQMDTARGLLELDIVTQTAEAVNAQGLTNYGVNSINVGTDVDYNANLDTITHYIFQEKAGFYATIGYQGNATPRTISHPLGVQGGLMIVKARQISADPFRDYQFVRLYTTTQAVRMDGAGSTAGITALTDTSFTLSGLDFNESGTDYIVEMFAHNPAAGIFAGEYFGTGNTGLKIVTGFPVGWVLIVANLIGSSGIVDIVSGVSTRLVPSNTGMIAQPSGITSFDTDGFTLNSNALNILTVTYKFIAIKDPTAP